MWLIILVYAGLVCTLTAVSYALMFRPKCKSLEFTRQASLERGEFDENLLNLDWQEWSFASPYGYALKGQYLQGKKNAPAALFVHGITWSRYGMVKYMRPFIERGWNVAAFDLAGHGASIAPRRFYPSYGFYEKYDIKAGVEALHSLFSDARLYGLFGESLGAASALQYAPLAKEASSRKIDFIVADCSFSSAWEELLEQYREIHIPNFIAWPSAHMTRFFVRLLRGFDLKEASPSKAVMLTDMPIIFAHGMEDSYVPTIMSVQMASARMSNRIGLTDLVLIPGAGHAVGILTDKARWLAAVDSFIDRVFYEEDPMRDSVVCNEYMDEKNK
ncbi:MAG: alpha/beta fold hydrolase [Treponema sp.]|nr:alpha/beta fold hydrolase [Treponema sp.]HOE99224.1 alpha/beta fold hydrolase [Rectinema sp.]HOR91715.1 alpha/beta fold hydrolase [Rectinema sp.]HQJ22651.1 alpha/beta fold hydrolase [Rectinema sp.]